MHCAEQFTSTFAYHGEGPFWDSRNGRLLCMDVLAADVVSVDSGGQLVRHPVPAQVVSMIRLRENTGFVIATEHGLLAANQSLTAFEHLVELPAIQPTVRTNDGGCDPYGGLIIGTMDNDERRDAGAVYRIAPDHSVTQILCPVSISNGIQWSGDGSRAFYIDTPTRRVDVFRVAPEVGTWSDRRTHIRFDKFAGFPDGMAIDEDDGLWIAMWGAGAVRHYDSTGRLIEIIEVPGVTQASSCTFGGEDQNILFITTSRKGMPLHHQPSAGAVFAIQTNVRGATPGQYSG